MPADGSAQTSDVNDPLKSVAAAMASAAQAVKEEAGDAAARVQQAIPAAGPFVSRFVYSSCYFLSYGVVFPTMLVAHYVPGGACIVQGLADGATAAVNSVNQMRDSASDGQPADAAATSPDNSPLQEGLTQVTV